jgi:hypothetical protein
MSHIPTKPLLSRSTSMPAQRLTPRRRPARGAPRSRARVAVPRRPVPRHARSHNSPSRFLAQVEGVLVQLRRTQGILDDLDESLKARGLGFGVVF